MKIKAFLGIQALIFIPYGLYCLVNPEMLSGAAGLVANSQTGTIELQAMYGGLQTSVGVMCAMAAWQSRLQFSALTALSFIFAGLAVARVTLSLLYGDFSGYTVGAMIFESVSLVLCLWLLKSANQAGNSVLDT
jgi:hypothetical protein